jgi:F-type H+-transporting ATPase subunit gamma
MQSAERSVAERLDELRGRHRRRRQAAITGELMDVVAGFEALGRGAEAGEPGAGDAEAAT